MMVFFLQESPPVEQRSSHPNSHALPVPPAYPHTTNVIVMLTKSNQYMNESAQRIDSDVEMENACTSVGDVMEKRIVWMEATNRIAIRSLLIRSTVKIGVVGILVFADGRLLVNLGSKIIKY